MGESLSPKTSDTLSTSISSRPRQQAKGQEAEQKPHRRALRAQGSKICSSSTVRQDHSYSLTRGQMQREKWGSKRGGGTQEPGFTEDTALPFPSGCQGTSWEPEDSLGTGQHQARCTLPAAAPEFMVHEVYGDPECHLPSTSCRRPCFCS